jgi:Na+-translocating ferredoxin:NAD+ oxidoreductase RnfD subunit
VSISVTSEKTQGVFSLPLAKPLDESVWQAWVLKGRAQDERSRAAGMKAVTWISLVTLLLAAAAGFWSHITPYDVAVRFLLTAGGLVLMFQAFHTRHYAFATVFGALALLYNPVTPAFSFSGQWQNAFVIASAVPFIASLTWRNAKLVPNA